MGDSARHLAGVGRESPTGVAGGDRDASHVRRVQFLARLDRANQLWLLRGDSGESVGGVWAGRNRSEFPRPRETANLAERITKAQFSVAPLGTRFLRRCHSARRFCGYRGGGIRLTSRSACVPSG